MNELFELDVNGRPQSVECDSLTPLQEVLHNKLGLLSVRCPCGVGVCGACSVLIDGRVVVSCLYPVSEVDGRAVLTCEGLADDHPVRAAFERAGAFQCGYCIPGFVMAATAWWRERVPDPVDCRDRLAGNLCRCGSYAAIVRAIQELCRQGIDQGTDRPRED